MFKMKTKLFSVLLAALTALLSAVMAFAILFNPTPTTAFAAEATATLSFANKAQRTSYSTSQQVWEQNGITLTNDKSSSTTNVGDYANPARFYASSQITIAYANGTMTKIEFVCDSGSYATALKNSIGTTATVSVSGSNVTVTLDNVDSFTIAKLTAQVRMKSLTVTGVEANAGCTHDGLTKVDATPATCTDTGNNAYYACAACGKYFKDASATVETTVNDEKIAALGHTWGEDACTACGKEIPDWQLVKNVSDLAVGDTVVIAAKDYNYALSTTQNNNNRAQATIEKVEEALVVNEEVQVLTLEAGNKEGTFAFYTGSGYLYAASSGSNHLKTEKTLSDNSSWKIEIAADGTATVVAQGTYTRNVMQYNQSDNLFSCYAADKPQKPIVLYKHIEKTEEPVACTHENTTDVTVEEATCAKEGKANIVCDECGEIIGEKTIAKSTEHKNTTTTTVEATCKDTGSVTITCDDCGKTLETKELELIPHSYEEKDVNETNGTSIKEVCSVCGEHGAAIVEITSASLTVKEDITVNYYVILQRDFTEVKMNFTVLGKTIEKEWKEEDGKEEDGRYKFSIELAPQYMTENIEAKLILDGKEVASMAEYSIQRYAINTLNNKKNPPSDELKELVINMLHYGAAAQEFKNYKTDDLANDIDEITEDPEIDLPTETDFNLENNEGIDSYPVYFKGAGVFFDNVNKIYVSLSSIDENVTLTINGDKVELDGTTVYTDGIYVTDFDETFTFELYYDGVVMQTLTYSVNAYVFAMINSETAGEPMRNLALALYNYGLSASAYNN